MPWSGKTLLKIGENEILPSAVCTWGWTCVCNFDFAYAGLTLRIYHCIKVIIKISSDYINEIFCCTNLLPQNLLQQLVSTIAMTLMLPQ